MTTPKPFDKPFLSFHTPFFLILSLSVSLAFSLSLIFTHSIPPSPLGMSLTMRQAVLAFLLSPSLPPSLSPLL